MQTSSEEGSFAEKTHNLVESDLDYSAPDVTERYGGDETRHKDGDVDGLDDMATR